MALTIKIGKTNVPPMRLLTKFRGCMLGGAVGDAMGMPVETYSRAKIQARFGTVDTILPRVTKHRVKDAGVVTDDTYLAMLTAKSLTDCNDVNIEHMTRLYIGGLGYPFGITGTTRHALELRAQGLDPAIEIKGNRHSGCGAAVRMPPLAMFRVNNMDRLIQDAVSNAKITHQDNDAVAGSVAIALTVGWGLRDELDTNTLLDSLNEVMDQMKSNLFFNFKVAKELLASDIRGIDGIEEIGVDAASVRLIPSAIYAFLKNPRDFHTMMVNCVNAGGDTDSRAALAGFISGAYNGFEYIPKNLSNKIGEKMNVLELAERMFDLCVAQDNA